jgi:hypothetical protein
VCTHESKPEAPTVSTPSLIEPGMDMCVYETRLPSL